MTAAVLAAVCSSAAIVLVIAERTHAATLRTVAKLVASSAFVALAFERGAMHSPYGRLLIVALALSWLGDVLLLASADRWFLAGIAAFLLAHVAFAAAFLTRPMSGARLAVGSLAMAVVAAIVLPWLWPHLAPFYKVAVTAYVVALAAMVALAIGASGSSGVTLPVGAIAFAASDISVARDRFVAPGFVNKAWGLPLYYAAQLLLALSIAPGIV